MDEDMDATFDGYADRGGGADRVLAALRPALPAAVAAFALTFLAAWAIPMDWLSAICWQLYLDTLHPIFVEPLGNATRFALGLGAGLVAALLAMLVALALTTTELRTLWQSRRTVAREGAGDADARPAFVRPRRADDHPDAPPVAPLNALRDLPPEGLVPDAAAPPLSAPPLLAVFESELLELAITDSVAPAEPLPDPADMSLGAMVARFEAGLERRRGRSAGMMTANPANEDQDEDPVIDVALEAALSTLRRMNQSAVG